MNRVLKSPGDSDFKEWVTVIWICFVGFVVFEKICLSFCDGIFMSRFEDCRRAFLSGWDASAFAAIIIRFQIRFGRILFVGLVLVDCIVVFLNFCTRGVVDVWVWWSVFLCWLLLCWQSRLLRTSLCCCLCQNVKCLLGWSREWFLMKRAHVWIEG